MLKHIITEKTEKENRIEGSIMKKILIIMIMLFAANCFGQDYFKWRIAHEKWVGRDKVVHITGSYLMCAGLDYKFKLRNAMIMTSAFNLAWEIKDAWVPYEKVGDWGGQGFSITDYMIGNSGILLYAATSYLYSKLKSTDKKADDIPDELKISINQI